MNKVKCRVHAETAAAGHIYDQELAKANLSDTALPMAPTAQEARMLKKTSSFQLKFSL